MAKRKKKKPSINILSIIIIIILLAIVIFIYNKNKNVAKNDEIKTVSIEESENDERELIEKNNQEFKADSSFSIKQSEIKEERIKNNKYLSEKGLPILMYHFFYDKTKGEKGKDGNWIEISEFEEQIKYLTTNEFYYPTWQEVEEYLDGKIKLPEKSVVITVDDGDPSFFELAVPIIQKYDAYATSFIVTYWYGDRAENKENNICYQSHSNDMHKAGSDGKGVMLSWNYDQIKEDVVTSANILGNANIFCYPFGHYNELDIKVLKENGYNLAVTTEARKSKNRYG